MIYTIEWYYVDGIIVAFTLNGAGAIAGWYKWKKTIPC